MGTYLQFLNGPPDSSLLYEGHYDPGLVLLSVLIAVFAAFAALDVAGRVGAAERRSAKIVWLAVGSVAMGGGIWAMHFIGMLSFSLPCLVRYDPVITLLSLVPGILASAVALLVISRHTVTGAWLAVGGVCLGGGIGAMHYSGMAAMRMDALLRYDPALFALSIAVAVVLAVVALRIKFVNEHWPVPIRRWAPLGSAAVMGGAVSGMHYTAMAAAFFIRQDDPATDASALNPTFLAVAVTVVTGLLIALALAATIAHRQIEIASRLRSEVERRRRVEEALRASEERFRVYSDLGLIGMAITDADLHWVHYNNRLRQMLGLSRTEMGAVTWAEITHPEDWPDVAREFDCIRAGKSNGFSLDKRLVRANGENLFVSVKLKAVRQPDGSLGQLVSLLQDITDRKKTLAALEAKSEELARSNADLEQFAYVASHDLQEPLRMVTSYVQLLERRYGGQLDETAADYMAFIVEGAKRMSVLIKDLLEFSRVDTQGRELVPTDCGEVASVVLRNLTGAIADSEAVVEIGPMPVVRGDALQLTRLFQNLIGNALKYRNLDRPPTIRIGAEQRGREWVISVSDNGIGIEPEYFEKIFVLFQRLHGTGVYEGTGIGLAVCKKIVERHGGRIWLDSHPGEGTTFYFSLPAVRPGSRPASGRNKAG